MTRTQRVKSGWRGSDWVPRMALQSDWEEFVVPEFALPAQVGHLWHHSGAMAPERALALAVLQQAVADVARYAASGLRHHRRLSERALGWMALEDRTWPYSFVNLCAVFGLEPDTVRAALEQQRAAGVAPIRQAA